MLKHFKELMFYLHLLRFSLLLIFMLSYVLNIIVLNLCVKS